ncbi:hypothetical protein Aspvir_003342 [Aspergillus viridinutans]|uniref:Uncharacterized protein n=1 Tax=Aspergillus viridinutans TaxID=75553 RepID=A0A9P3FB64_ASPVI|nr:uncharacterized protein Aspvir_003342 [Aspergillus viridinutans]GIK07676.1 hypothetical protein Aspvir_003342 [Aspergillus viridinutans]
MPTADLKDLRAQLETKPGSERPTPQAPPQGTATGQEPAQAPAQTSAPAQAAPPAMAAAQAPAQTPAAAQTPAPTQIPAIPSTQQHQRSNSADIDMEEDEELGHNEKLLIIRAISDAPDDPTTFKNALDNALPFAVDFRKLQALLHPDKYQGEEKIQAQKAFQKLLSFREKSGSLLPGAADRHTNFYYGNDASRPAEHVEGQLSSYHKDAHERATPHLKVLFSALEHNPRLNPQANLEGLDEKAKAAVAAIDSINAEMRAGNERLKKDPDLGMIRYPELFGRWRVFFLQPELIPTQSAANLQWCQKFHYPNEWATFSIGASASSANSSGNSQPHASTDTPGNSVQLWNSTGGQIRTIAIVPRKTTRSINPGYTSSGETIRMVQSLGRSARFVVEDAQGRVRLVSSAAAGGQPALDGATRANIPTTLRGEQEIMKLRDQVRAGGQYGLNWLAVRELELGKSRLPFIVAGFWHQGTTTPLREEGVSRSALKKILAPHEADRLIAENMIGDPGYSVKEALAILSPGANSHSRPTAPLALPDREHNFNPWFPSMPQQFPPALNAPQGPRFQQSFSTAIGSCPIPVAATVSTIISTPDAAGVLPSVNLPANIRPVPERFRSSSSAPV